jgi:hypothetical protein
MTLAQSMYLRMGFVRAHELDEFIHEGANAEGEGVALHLKAFAFTLEGTLEGDV